MLKADLLKPTRAPRRSRLLLLALIMLAGLLAFTFQGLRGLWGPDEGRYANVALQMIDSGDYLVPRRSAEHPQFTKPPLTYWAIASSVKVFGRKEWALRLPSSLAFCLTAAFVLSLARRLTPARTWQAPVIYLTTLAPFIAVNLFVTEALNTLFLTLAAFGFVRVWHAKDGQEAMRGRLLLAIGFGLAFLTRGALSLLPALAMAVFARSSGLMKHRWLTLGNLFIFIAIALPWYLWMALSEPRLLSSALSEALLGPIAQAKVDDWMGGYLPLLSMGGLPWVLILFFKSTDLVGELRKLGLPLYRQVHQERYFLWLWLLLPVLAILLLHPGDPLFLMPAFVPLALLVAREVARFEFGRGAQSLLFLWVVALLSIKGIAARSSHPKDTRELAEILKRSFEAQPRQVVFVDEPALYGLRYYLDAPVARVSLGASDDPRVDAEFKDFIQGGFEQKIWITLTVKEPEFKSAAAQFKLRIDKQAQFGRYSVYALMPVDR
jgi:4-amino-4-deoxy-L-arabinose transferase-like glycosyltransferase